MVEQHHRYPPLHQRMCRRFSTRLTPGADHAAVSASSRSCHEVTSPLSVTVLSLMPICTLSASRSACRLKGLVNLAPDVSYLDLGLDLDGIVDSRDAPQAAYRILGGILLIPEGNLALQSHPAVVDRRLDVRGRNTDVGFQCIDDRRGDENPLYLVALPRCYAVPAPLRPSLPRSFVRSASPQCSSIQRRAALRSCTAAANVSSRCEGVTEALIWTCTRLRRGSHT